MNHSDNQPNHLQGQTSPYLLQHLYNPVDWYPWGSEALEKARTENKPILISIGYSACHWCHVMERESFEDREVAEVMNRYFVCIKVDREERPDVDHVFMDAVQMVEGRGGWPLNCFALPDGRPFWGGTYFPKSSWIGILQQIAELFSQNVDSLLYQADRIANGIKSAGFVKASKDLIQFWNTDAEIFFNGVIEQIDREEGGIKGAPKFPLPCLFEFLLYFHHLTGNAQALDAVTQTLRKMGFGGIYDQIGGGFARYATDVKWKLPHFEKMLYDNAQLVSLYANTYKVTRDPLFREVVEQTLKFVSDELGAPGGLYYSALDADSEGEEGLFYLWTEENLHEALGVEAGLMKKYFGIGGKGLWQNDKNILVRTYSDDVFAAKEDVLSDELKVRLSASKNQMLHYRNRRIRPALDNKILVSWNAMMVQALVDAYKSFGEEKHLSSAIVAGRAICELAMQANGRLQRNLSHGGFSIDGFLEDYAWTGKAFISLYEATGDEKFIFDAEKITQHAISAFAREETSLLSFSPSENNELPVDHYEIFDTVIPSSNSMIAHNLFLLSHYFERPEWARTGQQMLTDVFPLARKHSASMAHWGSLMLRFAFPFYTVAVVGSDSASRILEAFPVYAPNVLFVSSTNRNAQSTLFKNRVRPEQTLFYVCQRGICGLPAASFDEAKSQMIPWAE